MFRTVLALLLMTLPAGAEPMLLAAASTGKAMDAALAEDHMAALTSYGASGMLARQIEQGAPADVFLSANPKWMTYLTDAGLIKAEDVVVLMSNRLVLIAPSGADPFDPEGFAAHLEGENFVMADPATAPVGAYGQAALESLGLWGDASSSFVPMRNTLATVAAVASGEAALGLVYASDAAGVAGVDVVWTIPEDSHPPIRYLIAPVAQGADPAAGADMIAYLSSPAGGKVLAQYGFLPVSEGN